MYNLYDNLFLKEEFQKLYFLTPLEQINDTNPSFILIINKFLKRIIDSPEIIYKIIKYSTEKDLTYSFLLFITNNLYNNILSPEIISHKLLIIFENLLNDEINKTSDINDLESILTYSKVSKLIMGLKYYNEIQNYFYLIIGEIIENYENSGINTIHLVFKIDKLEEYIKKKEEMINMELNSEKEFKREEAKRKKNDETNTLNNIYKMRFKIDDSISSSSISGLFYYEEELDFHNEMNNSEIFMRKYAPDLNKNELQDIIKKHSNNEYIQNYLKKQLDLLTKDENLFSNIKFFEHLQILKDSEKILYYYQRNFNIVRDIIMKIYQKLKDTKHLIPYSIKCLCRIIYNLIKLKFPKLKDIEIDKYIKIFIFNIILEQFILSSDYSIIITSTIISPETKHNLKIIFDIWKHFVLGNFYTKDNIEFCDYTPFNWFFIDLIEESLLICEKIIDIDLPNYLLRENTSINNNIINTTNNFEKYENKNIYFYSACFTLEDLITLQRIINTNKNDIFYDKNDELLNIDFNLINKILMNLKKKDDLKSLNYYLYYEIFYSYNISEVIIKDKKEEYFQINEIKQGNNEEIELNELIKIKNYLCKLLFNTDLTTLVNNSNISLNNFKQLFEELDKNNKIESSLLISNNNKNNDFESSEIEDDELFPFHENNNNSFKLNIDNISKNYSENNYELFFTSLYSDISSSIKNYNFEILSPILDSINNIKENTNTYLLNQEKYKNNTINSKLRKFIEDEQIEVKINFKYNEDEQYFSISKINKNQKKLINDNSIKCHTIPDFIRKFPNFSKLQFKKGIDLFDLITGLNIKNSLFDYFIIIKEHLISFFPEKEINSVYSKLKKRILIKLYNKMFPNEPDNDDLSFHFKCLSLSWVKPEHLNQNDIYYNKNFIKITTNLFNQMNIEKSYSGKVEIIEKIFNIFSNLLKINKGDKYSTDDIAPICEYTLIKAKPERLPSNLKFIQIMMSENCSNISKMHFDYLKNYINIINNCNYNHFYGISEKEFEENCHKAKNEALEENN